jgi:hypothetical protein
MKTADEIKSSTPYIGFIDVMGRTPDNPVKVTIETVLDVSGEKIDGVRAAPPCTYALGVKGTDRKLLIQGRKKSFLVRKFGTRKTAEWIGKEVEIYADPTTTMCGQVVGGWKFVGMPPQKAQ